MSRMANGRRQGRQLYDRQTADVYTKPKANGTIALKLKIFDARYGGHYGQKTLHFL